MRLIVLIVIAALIAAAAIGSYIHYRSWNAGRLDAMIAEVAEAHGVDPALLKAVVEVQMLNARRGEVKIGEGESRWGLIPRRIGDFYLEEHGRHEWLYVCPSRRFPNHDPSKPEEFTCTPAEYDSDKSKRTCRARGCGQPLVSEVDEFRTNLDVVAWFLVEVEHIIKSRDPSVGPRDLRVLVVVAYRWGLPARSQSIQLNTEQSNYVRAVEHAYALYRPQFEKRAKHDAKAPAVPSAPF
jgi:hypothetical protein